MAKVVRFRRRRRKRVDSERGPWQKRWQRPAQSPQWPLVILSIGIALVLYVAFEFGVHSANQRSTEIVGRATVIDGDTIDIQGTRIRFHGIDAPESEQSCRIRGTWSRCGQAATLALANRIGTRRVACEPKDRDRYNRVVAVCRLGNEDLNAWMVASGWALAYRRYASDYIQEERAASASKRGMWQGDFVAPWDWRRGKRL